MNAREVAAVLAEIAVLSELAGDNPFRARAFQAAARRLETLDADLAALAREGRLTEIPGVGEGIAPVVRELVEQGSSSLHRRLRDGLPPGLFDVMRLPGLGTKRVRTLYAEVGIGSLDALEEAARAGRIATLPGFGAKTEAKLLEGLAFAREARGRRRYPEAMEAAEALLAWLRGSPGVIAAEAAGALRRRMEVADAVVLVAASLDPAATLAAFRALEGAGEPVVPPAGPDPERAAGRLSDGLPVHLRCVPPERFAAALLWETGSEEHLRQLAARAEALGFRLGPDGLVRDGRALPLPDEGAVYAALGLLPVPPELREGWGEIEAAAAGALPRLVTAENLRGTFHCHTTYSDGKATLAEMAEAARAKGWEYLGTGDHSRSAGYAGGLTPAAVRAQHRETDAWNREHGRRGKGRFRILKGTESEILADGSLDYDDGLLDSFDYVVGSVHSSFHIGERAMTERMVRAVSNPRLTMLGHATGRLLLVREGYEVDVRAVIDAAAEHGTAIEINADPHRLDLDWRHVRYAAERGVLVPINPDAHSTRGLDNVAFGINVARKGWLEPAQVLNTRTLEEVEAYLAERKQARAR